VTNALASTIDLLPTIAALARTPLPAGRAIDGVDISPLLISDVTSPRSDFLYYKSNGRLEGIREGDWKLLVKQPERQGQPDPAAQAEVMLFNLADDLGEKDNRAAAKPDLVKRLRQRMAAQDAAIEAAARPVWKNRAREAQPKHYTPGSQFIAPTIAPVLS
jgi:arylsulfatase A-like enzyme